MLNLLTFKADFTNLLVHTSILQQTPILITYQCSDLVIFFYILKR